MQPLTVVVPDELRGLVSSRFRRGGGGVVTIAADGTSTVLHVVESVGIPRTEVGAILVGGVPVPGGWIPEAGEEVVVRPRPRPQRDPPQRYVLDVHLGALARRMRLVGLDTTYRNDATDVELVAEASAGTRVLLTQDRGLLRRRGLPYGAYVRGVRADDQLADVLDRFAPVLDPWSRCPACNGSIEAVAKSDVAHLLEPGTSATYDRFSRCTACGRPYWRGAHGDALAAVVTRAQRQRSRSPVGPPA